MKGDEKSKSAAERDSIDDEAMLDYRPGPNGSDPTYLSSVVPADRLGDAVALITESPEEARIDAANGLRGSVGRKPRPEDFADILTPEGDSGGIYGSDIGRESLLYIPGLSSR